MTVDFDFFIPNHLVTLRIEGSATKGQSASDIKLQAVHIVTLDVLSSSQYDSQLKSANLLSLIDAQQCQHLQNAVHKQLQEFWAQEESLDQVRKKAAFFTLDQLENFNKKNEESKRKADESSSHHNWDSQDHTHF